MAAFGSYKNNSIISTTDPAVVASLPNWLTGMAEGVVGRNAPIIEELNGVLFHMSRQIAYLMQEGIAEYDDETTYFINSYCKSAGVVYKSLSDNNLNNDPATSPLAWVSPFTAPPGVPAGTIIQYAGSGTPTGGYYYCDGSQKLRSTHVDLADSIGETWGSYTNGSGGAGTTHLRLPDLRGKFLRGDGTDGTYTGPNVGVEQAESLKSHNHTQDAHGHTQDNHNHTQSAHGHTQDSHNHTQAAHKHTQDSHNHTQDTHNHSQNSHNHTQDSHGHTQNSHNHTQDSHNHTQNSHAHNHVYRSDWVVAAGPYLAQSANTFSPNGVTTSGLVAGATATNQAATATNQAATATNQGTAATNQAATATNNTVVATNQAATATNQDTTATNTAATATNQTTTAVNSATTATNQNATATNRATGGTETTPVNKGIRFFIKY